MTRLTIDIRNAIKGDLLAHRFAKEENKIKQENHKLAVRAYNALYTPTERRRMNDLPKGWLEEWNYLIVRLCGITVRLTLPESRRFPATGRRNFTVNAQDLRDKHDELHAAEQKLAEEKRKASAEIAAILYSVNTINQLVAAWPEVKPFIKKRIKEAPQLPSIKVEEVNAFLGLKAA